MTAISAFLLVVLVTKVSCEYPILLGCRDVPVKYNFNNSAYFNGTWYVTHSLPPEHGVCMIIQPQLSGRTVHEVYTIKRDGEIEYAEGYIYLGSFTKDSAEFVSQTRPVRSRSPIPDFIPMNVAVIDTDYTDYAIVYNCIKVYGGPSVFLIMSRNPDPDRISPNVEKELRRLQLKLSDFGSTKGLNCSKINQYTDYDYSDRRASKKRNV